MYKLIFLSLAICLLPGYAKSQFIQLKYNPDQVEKRLEAVSSDEEKFALLENKLTNLSEDRFNLPKRGTDPTTNHRPVLTELYALGQQLGEPYIARAKIAELAMNARLCFDHSEEERLKIAPYYKVLSDSIGLGNSPEVLDLRVRMYVAMWVQCKKTWIDADSNIVIPERLLDEPALADSQRLEVLTFLTLDNMRYNERERSVVLARQGLRLAEEMTGGHAAKMQFYHLMGYFFEKQSGDYERAQEMYKLSELNTRYLNDDQRANLWDITRSQVRVSLLTEDYENAQYLLDSLAGLPSQQATATRISNNAQTLLICRKTDSLSCQDVYNSIETELEELDIESGTNKYAVYEGMIQMGLYLLAKGEEDQAFTKLEEAFEISKALRWPDVQQMDEFLEAYDQLLAKKNNLEERLAVNQKLVRIKNYLLTGFKNSARARATFELDVSENKLAVQRAEQERSLTEQQAKADRTLFLALAGGLSLLLVTAGLFFFRSRRDARRIAEQKAIVDQSLSEKEVLLREIHHRVKNNLQIISSLLQKQARRSDSAELKEMIRDGQERIQSMALIHENLYRSDQLSGVSIKNYLEELTESLKRGQGTNKVAVNLKVADEHLDIDTAIPLGLILNELITNAYKYAFPGDRSGEVSVEFKKEANEQYLLRVSDNGVGLPSDTEIRQRNSLGLNLVRGLVGQLEGTINWAKQQSGTSVTIQF